MLCERGYEKDVEHGEKPKEHEDRCKMIKLLVPSPDSEEGKDPANIAYVQYACKQTLYQPLHWLAYWNDCESISYLLDEIGKHLKTKKALTDLMSLTSNDLTIVDVAGSNGSHESALIILDLLFKKTDIMEEIYGVKKKTEVNQVKNSGKGAPKPDGP